MRRALWLGLLTLSCLGPTDDASEVHDLRVLAVNTEPPDLMAAPCAAANPFSLECLPSLLVWGSPVKMTWLIEDPKGAGRKLNYQVLACANQGDLRCEDEGDFVQLAASTWVADAGELSLSLNPGATFVDDGGQTLLQEVQAQDGYRGLGGLRMPIVLHLRAGTEEVYAQKLMVFTYPFFPTMKQNVNPTLPGIQFIDGDAGVWGANDLPQFVGRPDAGVRLEPVPFLDLQESYVVPSFELKPLALVEAWKVAWHTDVGHFTPTETGGVGLDGEVSRHRVSWAPLNAEMIEKDVNFWFVVRDGRGGQSWISRRAHWKPR